jgi:hypothetical protein
VSAEVRGGIGRPCGDRTHDTLLKRQALYH